mmetsp:Transcript_10973/g.19377  ORF Transcript_10973/g.19377 Transcript_10973/m.19377 type:complete len:199 (-) Transcript_10973:99-695(-)
MIKSTKTWMAIVAAVLLASSASGSAEMETDAGTTHQVQAQVHERSLVEAVEAVDCKGFHSSVKRELKAAREELKALEARIEGLEESEALWAERKSTGFVKDDPYGLPTAYCDSKCDEFAAEHKKVERKFNKKDKAFNNKYQKPKYQDAIAAMSGSEPTAKQEQLYRAYITAAREVAQHKQHEADLFTRLVQYCQWNQS